MQLPRGFAYPSPSDFIRVMLCHLLMSATNDQLMLGVGGDAGVYVRPNATTLNSALSDSASSRYEAFSPGPWQQSVWASV